MQVGAIGSVGSVQAVSFRPYIYNTNKVNSASMNKVQAISDDLTSRKTDYSDLADREENENVNPLRRGTSADLAEIIQSQMQMSQSNAARIMKPAESAEEMTPAGIGELSVGGEYNMGTAEMTPDEITLAEMTPDEMTLAEMMLDEMMSDEWVLAETVPADLTAPLDTVDVVHADTQPLDFTLNTAADRPSAAGRTDRFQTNAPDEFRTSSGDGSTSQFQFKDFFQNFKMKRAAEAYAFSMEMGI